MNLSGRRPRVAVPAGLAAVAALMLAGSAGCGAPGAHHGGGQHGLDHGKVVGYLTIPYRVNLVADTGSAKTVTVRVHPGQRFSVKVTTSDGPFLWRQVGPAPDARIVRVIGDFNYGHCAKAAVGCRIPYFHVLQAKRAGTTAMTWLYHELTCTPVRRKMTQATRSCTAAVTFNITVS